MFSNFIGALGLLLLNCIFISMETTSLATKLNMKIEGKNSRHQNSDIPEEIVMDIISRLRVKPVFRLQCLSKNFLSITNDQSFIEAHLKQSTRFRPSFIINHEEFPKNQTFNFSIIQCNAIDSEITVQNLPAPYNLIWPPSCCSKIEIVGSCNGLIIFILDNEYCFIWNPSTMQCHGLPLPSKLPDMYVSWASWGFGYCAKSSVYKIVKIHDNYDFVFDRKCLVEVFTYRKDRAWRRLDSCNFDDIIPCNVHGITVNGIVYWIIYVEENVNKLLTFDLEKEKIATIFCPSSFGGKLMMFRGILALCVRSTVNENSFDLWVLKDDDNCDALNKKFWEKIYTIDEIYPRKPIRSLNDHQLLLLHKTETLYEQYSCSLYDLESKEIREIPEALPFSENQVHNFVESTVPLFA